VLSWFRRRAEDRRTAIDLYGAIVTRARKPAFFDAHGVQDTPEGRTALIILTMFPVLERLQSGDKSARRAARLLCETFVTDIDDSLREMGVGDLTVPKKVKRAAQALGERCLAYSHAAAAASEPVASLAQELAITIPGLDARADGAEVLARATLGFRAAVQSIEAGKLLTDPASLPDLSAVIEEEIRRGPMTALRDWTHLVTDIPERGLEQRRDATDEERVELARELDVPACDGLSVAYEIKGLGKGHYRLSGTLDAKITQSCVVTLDPVPARISETFSVELAPATELEEEPSVAGDRVVSAIPDIEPIEDGRIDLGSIVFGVLSSALPPYPRKEDAAFEWVDPKIESDAEASKPFAALAKLKPDG